MAISATSGPVSSIDYAGLINQLIRVKEQPINDLKGEKKTLEKVSTALGDLNARILDLKAAADDLRASTGFSAFTTTVSDESVFTASASSAASAGTYDLVVSTLAKSHKIAADGLAAETSTVAAGAGSFKFTVGAGAEQTVSVDATTTLSDLRDSINALDAGVTATIVNDGSGATPYRLILNSDTTGTSNAITITQNDTTLNFATTLQAAQDATFTVDGLSVTRETNTVSDVITGVTFDLKSADAAKTVTLTVARDTEEITKKVTAFVDKYNAMVSFIQSKNRYDTETKTAGEFFGDALVRSIWDDLRREMTSAVSGLPDTMNRLIHVGITTDTNGKMSIDTSDLSDAINSNFDDFVNLFVEGASTSGFGQVIYDLANEISSFSEGRIKTKQDGISTSITNMEASIRRKEQELSDYENQLRAQFTALEAMIAGLRQQGNFLTGLGG